jgi:hypothetical protein
MNLIKREIITTESFGMKKTGRVYFKDAMPRLYAEMAAWIHQNGCDKLMPQIATMFITGRCDCGSEQCIYFWIESSSGLYAILGGRRPTFTDTRTSETGVMAVYSDMKGTGILAGFERIGDYPDGYIQKQLEVHGFNRVTVDEEVFADT